MTDYQNELVMEHLDLVNWVIRTRISVPNRPLLTYDDFYAIGCEAICRAALKYQADMSIFNPSGKQYLRCTKRLDNKSCPGCGKIITSELETVVYQQMVKKLASYKTLTGRKKAAKANPKIATLQVELAHVDSEIEKLVDSLTGANNVLLSYVNVKIAELDGRKQELLARIAELTVEAISPEQVSQISGYLDTWENVSFDDKRRVVDLMITTIAATSDSLNITWKI